MASAKQTPRVSRISRAPTVAYARKQKPPGDPAGPDDEDGDAERKQVTDAPAATAIPATPAAMTAEPIAPAPPSADAHPTSAPATPPARVDPAAAAPAMPPARGPTPPPAAASEKLVEPARARIATVAMPVQTSIGAPPAMPADAAPVAAPMAAAVDLSGVEHPTQMPGPREVPSGNPEDPAAPPGSVPRGDSRSLRRRAERYEFALIYRLQTFIITRFGVVGTRGQWRVVEYPTSASAGHAYAKEVSRFVSDGFSDYRE